VVATWGTVGVPYVLAGLLAWTVRRRLAGATYTTTVTVNNVAPEITGVAMNQANAHFILPVCRTPGFEAKVADPGSDDVTFQWAWGDGTGNTTVYYNDRVGPDPYPSPEISLVDVTDTVEHVYALPGDYTVTFTVTDDDTGVGTYTAQVTVLTAEGVVEVLNEYYRACPMTHSKGTRRSGRVPWGTSVLRSTEYWRTKSTKRRSTSCGMTFGPRLTARWTAILLCVQRQRLPRLSS